ncbi:putative divalent metal ion transporter SMF3 [Ascoidea rubescens DSM 1968]|uniref:YLR034Cp-like protein n=1 Tax=Ascoidea rubescens DSM 1968 TaxID=1344418 RepID=A0A1D2VKT1_9ASCO|nr:YLR034Cp-like protein [Ascoidea rubescens DSM 1968]ODV62212.1 YLR034Cp-like protein [Ascoidea rubescens DSM 1968]
MSQSNSSTDNVNITKNSFFSFPYLKSFLNNTYVKIFIKYMKFVGPGIMVSVAYMDPGNYSTSVSAGSNYAYKLLFAIFISNIFAIILQCLCVKLSSVTGLDLAENCHKNLPPWLNISIYVLAEFAIIATDLAEVVGTAISLEILFGIPLFYGVLLTILDVLIILFFYKPGGTMKQVRVFEIAISILVALTCFCFVLELTKISIPNKLDVFIGFLPSKEIFTEQKALYLSLGILGATVMPHSLYLGSALVQPRLLNYDLKHQNASSHDLSNPKNLHNKDRYEQSIDQRYKPSLAAIDDCLLYSYWELIISLFLVATFVNSAILIVAGSTLFGTPDADDADLLSIYEMLSSYISPAAGLIFALAMLFSGQSAGIICTMAGQIVSEGFINWSFKPWVRRIITRLIAIIPCLIITSIMGRKGISSILNGSQVVLSLILPFCSAPLIYFTCNKDIMKVEISKNSSLNERYFIGSNGKKYVDFSNSTFTVIISFATWGIIGFLNIYLIVSFLMGADIHF